ncbi:MAG: indolepyruvate ferredoxin oxidoreductase subunit alpha [Candidatus Niyogibacteria bacterium]|nr:indolepyruvate ferredoxin oxidoreductase subunit alpha [Candidatus Niyogibacteria bacterium]
MKTVEKLQLTKGMVLHGTASEGVVKACLESGIGYFAGYPGSPVAGIVDVAYEAKNLLKELGIHLASRGNTSEASAMAAGFANVFSDVRGAICFKIVGANVASDQLAHIAGPGVEGGLVLLVGDDPGCDSTLVSQRFLPMAKMHRLAVLEPIADLEHIAQTVRSAFLLSEHARMPVVVLLHTRVGNLTGTMVCEDNKPFRAEEHAIDPNSLDPSRRAMPVFVPAQLKDTYLFRLPRAKQFITEHTLNMRFDGSTAYGFITNGVQWNNIVTTLQMLKEADEIGNTAHNIFNIVASYPLVEEEIIDFLRGKEHILIIEEGEPSILEDDIKSIAYDAGLHPTFYGKELLERPSQYTPNTLKKGVARFLGIKRDTISFSNKEESKEKTEERPLPKRQPVFCTGCPERPIFTVLKLLAEKTGVFVAGSDIGCYLLGTLEPFNIGVTQPAMGGGLLSVRMLGELAKGRKRAIVPIGDGTFWHMGISSIADAVSNHQDVVLVVIENGWIAMTGDEIHPSTPAQLSGGVAGGLSIEATLKGMGVQWLRIVGTVNDWRKTGEVKGWSIEEMYDVLYEAVMTDHGGVKAVIVKGECNLQYQRGLRKDFREAQETQRRFQKRKFGVDATVCTGDKSCMRCNGCISLTIKDNPDPLRDDPVAACDSTCTGCGLCGENAHLLMLCPAFYATRRVMNPTTYERILFRANAWMLKKIFGVRIENVRGEEVVHAKTK